MLFFLIMFIMAIQLVSLTTIFCRWVDGFWRFSFSTFVCLLTLPVDVCSPSLFDRNLVFGGRSAGLFPDDFRIAFVFDFLLQIVPVTATAANRSWRRSGITWQTGVGGASVSSTRQLLCSTNI